jgi:hypothetical protein
VSEREDDLLHVVSAWRELKWRRFRDAFDILYPHLGPAEDQGSIVRSSARRRALNLLQWLGHCDVPVAATEPIYCAPPVLARLSATRFPQAVLCGARSPHTTDALQGVCARYRCRLLIECQPQNIEAAYVPRRIVIEADSENAIADVAQEMHIAYSAVPPAWDIAKFSASLDEYLMSCPPVQLPDIDWVRHDFNTKSLQVRPVGAAFCHVRLSRYQHPLFPAMRYYLWNGNAYREVEREWGCYALLRHAGIHVLAYDPRHLILAVPSGAALPRMLARACTLCSGYAPRFVPQTDCPSGSPGRAGLHVFPGVPLMVAQMVADKLGQPLDIKTLPTLFRGVA